MALIDCKFFSETLGMSCSMQVILPEETTLQIGLAGNAGAGQRSDGYPTLLLLHGLSDDDSIWIRRTSIERYVAPLGLAVIMPNVHRSFYTNMQYGYRYWDFVTQELLSKARSFFPLSSAREKNFVAGLSMGGFGALKIGFSKPELFAAAASLSGLCDVEEFWENRSQDFELVFHNKTALRGSPNDLYHLSKTLAESKSPKPRIFQCCGTEDYLHSINRRFRGHMEKLGYDYTYEEGPGSHEWGYWDQSIQRVLEWLHFKPAAGAGELPPQSDL